MARKNACRFCVCRSMDVNSYHYSNFPHGLENWVTLPDFEAREALFQLGLAGRPFNKNIDYNHWHM